MARVITVATRTQTLQTAYKVFTGTSFNAQYANSQLASQFK